MTTRRHGVLRSLRGLSQETSLSNAAEAVAKLRRRRHQREEVDSFLVARTSSLPAENRMQGGVGGS